MKLDRRTVLRGTLGGGAVTLALPFLDCFLDTNGTALAASGRALPVRFGTWFWGLGYTPGRWVPNATGANYDLPAELKPLDAVKSQVNVLSGFDAKLDGGVNIAHQSGTIALRTGAPPKAGTKSEVPTLDVVVSDAIGQATRFRSLELAATGNPKDSYSLRNSSSINPGEGSPLGFYMRVFGPEFQDPNAGDFKPDPRTVARVGVLSAVKEDRERLLREVGASDRARLDEYMTSLRQLENQLALQLEKPPPAEACSVPKKPGDPATGYEINNVTANHKVMAELLALALACNQTKVFNMVYSDSGSNVRRQGTSTTHHVFTHEELEDKQLGYQVNASWFVERSMEAFATFVQALASVREGPGTLLDNTLLFGHSDSSFAKAHAITSIPVLTAGKAGGRMKTGLHIAGNGDSISRLGLTAQQAVGMPVQSWGQGSMATSKPVTDLFA